MDHERIRKLAGLPEVKPKLAKIPSTENEVQSYKVEIDPKTGAPKVSDEKEITTSAKAKENNKVPTITEDIAPQSLSSQQITQIVGIVVNALKAVLPQLSQAAGGQPGATVLHDVLSQPQSVGQVFQQLGVTTAPATTLPPTQTAPTN